MVSDYVIMKIEHLKRKHDIDCGIGSWCDCGADQYNKKVDWIINEIRTANAKEGANLHPPTAARNLPLDCVGIPQDSERGKISGVR